MASCPCAQDSPFAWRRDTRAATAFVTAMFPGSGDAGKFPSTPVFIVQEIVVLWTRNKTTSLPRLMCQSRERMETTESCHFQRSGVPLQLPLPRRAKSDTASPSACRPGSESAAACGFVVVYFQNEKCPWRRDAQVSRCHVLAAYMLCQVDEWHEWHEWHEYWGPWCR